MQKIVITISSEHTLRDALQRRLQEMVVANVSGFDGVNDTVKQKGSALHAVIVDLDAPEDWMVLELLKTGYKNIPRFGILTNARKSLEINIEETQQRYQTVLFTLPTTTFDYDLIANTLLFTTHSTEEAPSETVHLIGNVSRELARIVADFGKFQKNLIDANNFSIEEMAALGQSFEHLRRIRFINPKA